MKQNTAMELPQGWVGCAIDDITRPIKRVDAVDMPDRVIRYIDISGIDNLRNIIAETKSFRLGDAPSRARQIVEAGDVLFATVRPYLRNIAAVPSGLSKEIASTGFAVLRPAGGIDPKFLFLVCTSTPFINAVSGEQYGVSYPAVKDDQVRGQRIWLPPSREQQRIVKEVEGLFAEMDQGLASLRVAREGVKFLRQALLRDAFEGKFTAKWRKENNSPHKTGAALKTDLLKARRDLWESTQTRRYKQPAGIKQAHMPPLPTGWTWVGLDELVSGEPRSLQSGPFGSSLKHSEFVSDGVLVIGIDNVQNGTFSMGSQNRITQKKFKALQKYQARPGDVLVTVMASLGRTCVVPSDLEPAIITKHVYRVTMNPKFALPEFYNLALQGPTTARRSMLQSAQGQTRPGLNGSILKEIPLPFCSLEEQREIVERLNDALSLSAKLASEIDEQIQRTQALRESILIQAFSGKLVPQIANEESAQILLDRIKAEVAEKNPVAKTNRRKAA